MNVVPSSLAELELLRIDHCRGPGSQRWHLHYYPQTLLWHPLRSQVSAPAEHSSPIRPSPCSRCRCRSGEAWLPSRLEKSEHFLCFFFSYILSCSYLHILPPPNAATLEPVGIAHYGVYMNFGRGHACNIENLLLSRSNSVVRELQVAIGWRNSWMVFARLFAADMSCHLSLFSSFTLFHHCNLC